MKLFLVCLAVSIGAASASGGLCLSRCSKTAEECMANFEVIHFADVEGKKCVYYITSDIHTSEPSFDNAVIESGHSEEIDGVSHTPISFTRLLGTTTVKTTEAVVCEPSSAGNLFGDLTGYPAAGDLSNIMTVRCRESCHAFLTYLCNPKEGSIGKPTFAIWSDSEDVTDEDLKACCDIAHKIEPSLEFVKLTTP